MDAALDEMLDTTDEAAEVAMETPADAQYWTPKAWAAVRYQAKKLAHVFKLFASDLAWEENALRMFLATLQSPHRLRERSDFSKTVYFPSKPSKISFLCLWVEHNVPA